MKTSSTLLVLWLSATGIHALDIELTSWKQITPQLKQPWFAVDGVLVGAYADIGNVVDFSVDGGTTSGMVSSNLFNRLIPTYRGGGAFQVQNSLYRIVDNKAVKVGSAAPGALGTSTAIHGDRWITVAENVVYVSENAGRSWSQLLNPWGTVDGSRVSLNQVYHDGETFVGTGTGTWRSADGVAWHQITNVVVSPTFTGELGTYMVDRNGVVQFVVLRGDELVPLAPVNSSWQVAVVPGGVFAWNDRTLRFYATNGTTVETAMPLRIQGVFRRTDQSIRVFTQAPATAWDSLPLTEPPFQQPVITSIAMVARLMVTGTPNSTVTVEGGSTSDGPWQPVGRVLVGGNGQATWTDSVSAERAGWFYRMSVNR